MGCKLEAEGRVRQAGERTSGITELGATGLGPGNRGRCGAVSAIAPSSASSPAQAVLPGPGQGC